MGLNVIIPLGRFIVTYVVKRLILHFICFIIIIRLNVLFFQFPICFFKICVLQKCGIEAITNTYYFIVNYLPDFPTTQFQIKWNNRGRLLQFLVKNWNDIHEATYLYVLSQGGVEKIFTFLFGICNNRFPSHANTSYNPMSNCYNQWEQKNYKNTHS